MISSVHCAKHAGYRATILEVLDDDFEPSTPSTNQMKLADLFTKNSRYKAFQNSCAQICDKNDFMCRPTTRPAWNGLLKSSIIRFETFIPEGKYVYEWEKEYLSFSPVEDLKRLPDLRLSTIKVQDAKESYVSCDVGQRLIGRVDLKDGYGKPRQEGLDEVRAWLVDSVHRDRSAVAQVTDYRNGSYGLGITCLWPGSHAMLRVSVSYPREYLRAVIQQVNSGATRFTGGLFKSDKGFEEVTLCHPTPNIPGRKCLCNFTSFNTREYYCGRPLDTRLLCSDWKSTFPLDFPLPYNVTPTEAQIIKEMPGNVSKRTLKARLLVKTSSRGRLRVLPKCFDVSSNVTWDISSRPQGFWNRKGVWKSLLCQTSVFESQEFLKCFSNSTVYVIGDSNANRIYSILVSRTESITTEPGSWPRRAVAQNKAWGITVEFRPHDYPLFLKQSWEPLLRYGSVETQIDAIPSQGRFIVILHYFLHLVPFHLSVVQSRVEAAARSIRRLLNRNPEARVAFRGPHVASQDSDINHAVGGDNLGRQYMEIISKAFTDLKERVVFLDGWEMTISKENAEFHPDDSVPFEMVRIFMSFLCK
ncbi:nxpe family member 3 [Plakobranchus ocellatus]|uniref:Nxpe family member 3 n=1 Tax=Plakobranchus ocellatus TaxID=259542 RepID=A0AAV3YRS0_9GAST|nr:nxpe family member 3 [Plakobranchus ocellatus]